MQLAAASSNPKNRTGGFNLRDGVISVLPGHANSCLSLGIRPWGLKIAPRKTLYEQYHPYGTSAYRAQNGSLGVSAKRYRYNGKERDDETKLYYYGARYYAPWLGRWTAADPLAFADGVGAYTYVRGSPVVLSDPNGNQSAEATRLREDLENYEAQIAQYRQLANPDETDVSELKRLVGEAAQLRATLELREELEQIAEDVDVSQSTDPEAFGEAVRSQSKGYIAGTSAIATYDARQRSAYKSHIEARSRQAVSDIDAARRVGDIDAAERAARDASDFRNQERSATQRRLSPGARAASELIEQDRSWTAIKEHYRGKLPPGSDDFDLYESIARGAGKSNVWVSRLALANKILGPLGTAYGLYSGVSAVAEAPEEERNKVAAEETGAFLGGTALGIAGSWAGATLAGAGLIAIGAGTGGIGAIVILGAGAAGGVAGSYAGGEVGANVGGHLYVHSAPLGDAIRYPDGMIIDTSTGQSWHGPGPRF